MTTESPPHRCGRSSSGCSRYVQKPIQYVGGELNSTPKDWDAADVRWCLMYPDAYEVGLPNQGVQILYEILNEREGFSPSGRTPSGRTSKR